MSLPVARCTKRSPPPINPIRNLRLLLINRRLRTSKNCLPNSNRKVTTSFGYQAIGRGTIRKQISSGSVVFGETFHRVENGFQVTGIKSKMVTVGCQDFGQKRLRKKLLTCLSLPPASIKDHQSHHQAIHIFTYLETGISKTTGTSGEAVIGNPLSRIGFGCRRVTFGRHQVVFINRDTGTMKSQIEAPALHPFISKSQFIRPTITATAHLLRSRWISIF